MLCYKIQVAQVLFDIKVTEKNFLERKLAEPTCQTAPIRFLLSIGRKIHSTLGDGNCLFRSFSKELFSIETHHLKIRTLLTDVIKWNVNVFNCYLTPPLTGKSITEHVRKMQMEYTWGTHVEIYAMASVLHIPIRLYTLNLVMNIIGSYLNHWK